MSDVPQTIEFAENPGFDVSPTAIKHAKRRLLDAGEPVVGLRVGVRGGGCSGYSYVFDHVTKLKKRDLVFDFDGLNVVVDNKSIEYLAGAVLDWEQRLMGYGFKWRNPNVESACGCGESFSVKTA